MRDAYIELSADQMDALCASLGLPLPTGLEPGLLEGRPEAVRDYLQAQAIEDLVARKVMTRPEDGGRIEDAVADVLRVAAEPGLLVVATAERDGVAETRFYAVAPDLGVEQAPLSSELHRFTPFAPSEVLKRALRFVDLRPHEALDVEGFRLRTSVLDQVGELLLDGQDEVAAALLAEHAIAGEAAEAFLKVAAGAPRTVSVTIFYRPSETEVAGGSLLWLDGGLDGLWVAEAVEDQDEDDGVDDDPVVDLRPSTGHEVARELLSYLPSPFAGPPSEG